MKPPKSIPELLIELNNLERLGSTAEEIGNFVSSCDTAHHTELLRAIKLDEPIPIVLYNKGWDNTYKIEPEECKIYVFPCIYSRRLDDFRHKKATVYSQKEFILLTGAPIKTDFSRMFDK